MQACSACRIVAAYHYLPLLRQILKSVPYIFSQANAKTCCTLGAQLGTTTNRKIEDTNKANCIGEHSLAAVTKSKLKA
jgi:hypothetical protein